MSVDAAQNLNFEDPESDYLVVLEEGQTYDLDALEAQFNTVEFALLCITDPKPFVRVDNTWSIGSVGLRDNNYRTHVGRAGRRNGRDYNSEGSPPYTLADDSDGDYNPTDFRLGEEWSITCQAFCEENLAPGELSEPVTRNFTITSTTMRAGNQGEILRQDRMILFAAATQRVLFPGFAFSDLRRLRKLETFVSFHLYNYLYIVFVKKLLCRRSCPSFTKHNFDNLIHYALNHSEE